MTDLSIPEDLVDLQRSLYQAQSVLEAFSRTIDAENRAVFPEQEQWRQRIWPEDGPERAWHQRLRAERNALMDRIREHPAMVAASAGGTRVQLDAALKKAGRAAA